MRDNVETDYLILISSDGKKTGYETFKDRISNNLWPIYKNTPQMNNIKIGKKVIFYIAGKGDYCQNFIGSGTIGELKNYKAFQSDPNREFKQVNMFIKFDDFKYFKKIVHIKKHLDNLSFIKNKEKYGLSFQGGICKIDQSSYDYILNYSK